MGGPLLEGEEVHFGDAGAGQEFGVLVGGVLFEVREEGHFHFAVLILKDRYFLNGNVEVERGGRILSQNDAGRRGRRKVRTDRLLGLDILTVEIVGVLLLLSRL